MHTILKIRSFYKHVESLYVDLHNKLGATSAFEQAESKFINKVMQLDLI
jgi:hypothetical protein